MQIDYEAIGHRLKAMREKKSLTQEQVAEISGISTVHIGNIENARKKVGLEKLLLYCETLGVTVDYILGVSDAIVEDDTLIDLRYMLASCGEQDRKRLIRIIKAYIAE